MTLQELENMRRSELLSLAKKIGIKGFSRLTKPELLQNIMEVMEKGSETVRKEIQKWLKAASRKSGTAADKGSAPPVETAPESRTGKKPATATEKAPSSGAVPPKAGKAGVEPKTVAKSASSLHPPKPGNEPAAEPDADARTRTSIAAMRYADPPLYQRGQLVSPEQLRDIDADLPDLPIGYGDGTIHLMPRDPKWLFCYWDISEERRASAGKYDYGRLTLRLHDVTHVVFDGTNSWSVHQFALNEEARWWYIPVPSEGRHFMAELGYRMPDGTWNSLGLSDTVIPPPGSQSPWVHDVFITLPFEQPLPVMRGEAPIWLQDATGGHVPDRNVTPQAPLWGSPVNPPAVSPFTFGVDSIPTSPGVSSFVQLRDERNELMTEFPLIVNADLRVFGATSPEVSLEIDGKPHTLSADGTFTVAFPFPDGSQSHKVTARDSSGAEKSIQISFHRSRL